MYKEKENSLEKCPKCGSDNIKYGTGTPEGNYYYYEGACNKCKTSFKEYYKMVYQVSFWEECECEE